MPKTPARGTRLAEDFAYDLRVALRGLKGASSATKDEDMIDYVKSAPFFENFEKDQVKEILKASEIIKAPKGEIIVLRVILTILFLLS